MRKERFIALDMGTDGIRMGLFIRHGSEPVELIDDGFVRFDSNPPPGMAREAVVAMALKQLLDEKKPSVRSALISIEGSAVFSRLVKLPRVGGDKLWQAIGHEAVQNIPFPINEVVWDAHVVDPDAAEPEVMLVAVKEDLVGGLVHAVSANGLQVERVDVAPAALANAVRLVYPDSEGASLLVDIASHSTNLVFVDGDRTFFRTLPIGGGMLTHLAQDIERSISFYRGQQGGNVPRRILLTGDPIEAADFQSVAGLPVEVFDPLQIFNIKSAPSDPGHFAVLAGLATPSAWMAIDLVPESVTRQRFLRSRQPLWAASAALILLIGGIWTGGLNRMADLAQQENHEVSARVQTLENIENQLLPIEQRIQLLEEQSAVFRQAIQARTFWLKALAELRAQLPDGMFLLESEPLRSGDALAGMRVAVVSYLDKEPAGEDAVIQLRDRLRTSERFSDETQVFKRPTKRLFARQFVLDIYFEEGLSQ